MATTAIGRFSNSSPTAELLRHSRLFTVPKPLPVPIQAEERIKIIVSSDSATAPYPTHQAIWTPMSSRQREDWGFKRPIPSKATRTVAAINIKVIDTPEKVTDFEDGSDHVKTLRKIQELNIAISRGNVSGYRSLQRDPKSYASAFEPDLDNTVRHGATKDPLASSSRAESIPNRWKFRGPDFRYMCDAEFSKWVKTKVKPRSSEFMERLKTRSHRLYARKLAEARPQRTRQRPNGRAEVQEQSKDEAKGEKDVLRRTFYSWMAQLDDAALQTYVESLQNKLESRDTASDGSFRAYAERAYSWAESDILQEKKAVEETLADSLSKNWAHAEKLFRVTSHSENNVEFMEQFLDVPYAIHSYQSYRYANQTTHPSAGLSYRRAQGVVPNHHLYGALKKAVPTRARVLPIQSDRRDRSRTAAGGLAGVTLYGSQQDFVNDADIIPAPVPNATHAGMKKWMVPTGARINADGRVILVAEPATDGARNVMEDRLVEEAREAEAREEHFRNIAPKVTSVDEMPRIARAKPIMLPSSSESSALDDVFKGL
jgi:hypothetical protein